MASGDSTPTAENEDSIDNDSSSSFSTSLVSLRVFEDDTDDVEASEIFDSSDADTD